jgi:glycogen debranching enzyme
METRIPDRLRFRCNDSILERAFEIALNDLASNIVPLQDGLLERESFVFRAGASYEKPWTRDAAINVWNGAGLLYPEVAYNTLLATLERTSAGLQIGAEYDQYWDRIIWVLGAWWLYLFSGNRDLLTVAHEAGRNTLASLEDTEFTSDLGLFRGPAVYGDGVSAYPDVYAHTADGHSSILRWPAANPGGASKPGRGLPMHALSTNCLYFHVYEVLGAMAQEVGVPPDPTWTAKSERIRASINRHFWIPERGHYRYLVDPFGGSDEQEGLGQACAILFGVADDERRDSVFRTQSITATGIPCLWPCFDRYRRDDHYGRHSGTVWPPIEGFWAEAAARHGRADLFGFELRKLSERAVRDGQFFELYHPESGLPYGGLQEWEGRGIVDDWQPLPHQTWSATGFLRMVLMGIAGMRFESEGVRFRPVLPAPLASVELSGVPYRDATLRVTLHGPGRRVRQVHVDGKDTAAPFLPTDAVGAQVIEIVLGSG